MTELEKYCNLLIKRLSRPLTFPTQTVYQSLPSAFKKQLSISNLQFFILVIFIVALLTSYLFPKDSISKTKLRLAHWPLSVKNHLALAEVYFEQGNLNMAKSEVEKANRLYNFFKVFDFRKKTNNQLESSLLMVNSPDYVNQQINYWHDVLKDKPNFRDVYLHLSLLYYQTWDETKAKEAWQKAFYLDPNNQNVKEIGKLIGELD